MIKADGSVLVHSDGGSYKPLNWMSPPCRLAEEPGRWVVTGKSGETLTITIEEIISDSSFELGVDPGLVKDGVEAHLQELLAAQMQLLGDGWRLMRREYPTAIGPVDLMCRDAEGGCVAIEIKRRGEIDGVEQLTRYLDLLNRTRAGPGEGHLCRAGDQPQARVLAEDRGIRCLLLDYDSCAAPRMAPAAVLTVPATSPSAAANPRNPGQYPGSAQFCSRWRICRHAISGWLLWPG
jgi:RecB family endonuclease NucS